MNLNFVLVLKDMKLTSIVEKIFSYLDADSLKAAELVSKEWHRVISEGLLWKKLIKGKLRSNSMWKRLEFRNLCYKYLFANDTTDLHLLYKSIYVEFDKMMKNIIRAPKIPSNSNFVYCMQYDDNKIVCGLGDNTIKYFDKNNLQCLKIITGHTGPVLCLQYDETVIISGASDFTVRVWDVITGELLNTLIQHTAAVLHLKFNSNGLLATCSKDESIAVWDSSSPTRITLLRTLLGHSSAVNAMELNKNFIISGSGDKTIRIWDSGNGEMIRLLTGHTRGVACLDYGNGLIVSGSSDRTIRIWDFNNGNCIRVLKGQNELVRCIRFDSKFIISGGRGGTIKIWDLQAVLNPQAEQSSLCIRSFMGPSGSIFRLQFDDNNLISSCRNGTILIRKLFNDNGFLEGDKFYKIEVSKQIENMDMQTEEAKPEFVDDFEMLNYNL